MRNDDDEHVKKKWSDVRLSISLNNKNNNYSLRGSWWIAYVKYRKMNVERGTRQLCDTESLKLNKKNLSPLYFIHQIIQIRKHWKTLCTIAIYPIYKFFLQKKAFKNIRKHDNAEILIKISYIHHLQSPKKIVYTQVCDLQANNWLYASIYILIDPEKKAALNK